MNRDSQNMPHRLTIWLVALAMAAGCAQPRVSGPDGTVASTRLLPLADDFEDAPDYDPWQPFNEVMFSFNHDVLDRFLVKPAATGWEFIMPAVARRGVARAFDNLEMPRRLVNNVLQLRPIGAGREIARFVVNTTVGVAGFVDVATMVDLEPSNADTGETLALYGVADGPYVVLPTMPPLTLRDAIGRTADGMLDPLGYFLPFVANQIRSVVYAVNERSLNLKLYADVEESVLDLYSAARNGYLQRRRQTIRRAYACRQDEWQWALAPRVPAEQPVVVAAPAEQAPAEQPVVVATPAEPVPTEQPVAVAVAAPEDPT